MWATKIWALGCSLVSFVVNAELIVGIHHNFARYHTKYCAILLFFYCRKRKDFFFIHSYAKMEYFNQSNFIQHTYIFNNKKSKLGALYITNLFINKLYLHTSIKLKCIWYIIELQPKPSFVENESTLLEWLSYRN